MANSSQNSSDLDYADTLWKAADALRAGLISEDELPPEVSQTLGARHSQRINTLVSDVILHSWDISGRDRTEKPREQLIIGMSERIAAAANTLREFMFQRVYLVESTLEQARYGQRVVRALYEFYERNPDRIDGWSLSDDPAWRRAADYVSGMTDGFAIRRATELGLLP